MNPIGLQSEMRKGFIKPSEEFCHDVGATPACPTVDYAKDGRKFVSKSLVGRDRKGNRKVGGKARSRGRSSPDSLAF